MKSYRRAKWVVGSVAVAAAIFQIGAAAKSAEVDPARPPLTDQIVRHPLSPADAVEMTRVFSMYENTTWSADGAFKRQRRDILISPDGKRYAVLLIRGDLKRNGNWLELICGSLESLAGAKRYEKVATLFLSSKATSHDDGSAYITHAAWNRIQWMPDSKRVTFLYSPDDGPVQIFAANVETRQVEPLTKAPRGVLGYEIDVRGTLLYTSMAPHSPAQSADMLRKGFAVKDTSSLLDILRGDVDGYTALDWTANVERHISTPRQPLARKIIVNREGRDRFWSLFESQFSPDGRYVLIDGTPDSIPAEWNRYTQPSFKLSIYAFRKRGMHDSQARQIKALYLVDLTNLSVKPLWSAPKSATYAAWSPDSRSIALGPTFLPPGQADSAGLEGTALAVIDVATRQFRQLPVPPSVTAQGLADLRWHSSNEVEITSGAGESLRLRKRAEQWQLVGKARAAREATQGKAAIRVELRQDMNTLPALYAVDMATGKSALVLDLNPALRSEVLLGRVEHYKWTDREQRIWSGLLYYPVGYTKGRRYPLVIQTHGHAPIDEFSLYGGLDEGLGPTGTPYAAQSLAGRGIAVLQIEDKNIPGINYTPDEAELYRAAYETAIESLTRSNLIDPSKVGLAGFSRTGFHIEYALVHSEFPYAAALASDNIDGGYLQHVVFGGTTGERVNGSPPFGEGLKTWLRTAVGFNVDRIRTPLRLEAQSLGLMGLLQGWEVFSRLRELERPVEYYVIPDIEHGTHSVQNPGQCLGSQEGAVDWFDFWLNGHEDASVEKADQYARWRELRALNAQQEATRRNPESAKGE